MSHALKFGAVLPLSDFAAAKEIASEAEAYGFYSIAAEDHFFMAGLMGHDRAAPRLECFTLLSALAPLTSKVILTQIVAANSFRHPALTAKIISSLHNISGGRVELGLGAGWFREEYDALGIPYPKPSVRIAQLDESLQIIKRLWHDEQASFEGEYYRIQAAPHAPKPKPQPRIMLGGGGEKLLRVAARHADVINIIPPSGGAHGRIIMEETLKFDMAAFEQRTRFLRDECARIGRRAAEIELSAMVYVMLGETAAQAETFASMLAAQMGVTDMQAVYRSPNTLVGTAEQVAEEICRRRDDSGITYFFANFLAPGMFAQFGREVLPRVL